ncbi:hypothetical protein FUA26_06665 [Seonamhaeicola algicola]|uniref:Uncharacterized protein n=1 Tax=Seonamhaeicola algicola TaxID=1719036 RepID=A0A5C7ASL5_9FLAO|nr:hypothetical protein FUA26_06665 [Seonamhaeicola algicola]
MHAKKLLIISILLTFTASLMIYIKLSYFFWSSKFDYIFNLSTGIFLMAALLALIVCIKSSIQFYNTQKFQWLWFFSTTLAISFITAFVYYLINK